MGAKTSKNIVSDTMTEDDSQSYNLINIHTPTANIGITVFFCLVGVVCLVRLYMYVVRARCARPKTGAGGRRLPVRRDTATVDMDSHIGHAMPAQGVAVLGGDAKDSYWTPRDTPCWTCMAEAWTDHGHKRARGRFGHADLVGAGNPRSVYGGHGVEDAPPTPRLRARWPGGREDSPPPRKRTRARSVESF